MVYLAWSRFFSVFLVMGFSNCPRVIRVWVARPEIKSINNEFLWDLHLIRGSV